MRVYYDYKAGRDLGLGKDDLRAINILYWRLARNVTVVEVMLVQCLKKNTKKGTVNGGMYVI